MSDVLIVVSTLGLGGNERSTINIYNSIKKTITTKIVTLDGSQCKDTKILLDNYYDLKTPASTSILVQCIHSVQRLFRFKKIVRKEKPKVIYLILNEGNVLAKVKYKKTKKVITCRDCGNLIKNHALFHQNLEKSDYLLFNSKYMLEYYQKQYPKDKGKTAFIYNSIDTDWIFERSKQVLPNEIEQFFANRKVIVSVGRFCNEKGYNHLIRAFEIAREKTHNLRLCIVGDGALMKNIREMVKTSKWSMDILLAGAQSNPYPFIIRAYVFVLSSISEGFPNVLLEALALNIPIVSTDCKSGPHEILDPINDDYLSYESSFRTAQYGILCPPFIESNSYSISEVSPAEQEMAKAIILLLNEKTVHTEYMNKSKEAIRPFQIDSIGEKYIDFFTNI